LKKEHNYPYNLIIKKNYTQFKNSKNVLN
jgi:hypothetical protein